MIQVKSFVFNPYQENTYILFDNQGNCAIIDPGMYGLAEQQELVDFIEEQQLKPVLLLNTHCHIDHVLGNRFVFDTYGLLPIFHEKDLPVLIEVQNYAPQMGFQYDVSPIGEKFLQEGELINLGQEVLEVIFAPGHAPGHLCFYHKEQGFLIGGDVLFQRSIGRTDLPGGNHDELLESIRTKLYVLPEETIVFPGHGPATSIGDEMRSNPFVRA